MRTARKLMPRNITPKIRLMTTRVMRAFCTAGGLKAVMPLEMASTPVSAVLPLEKARKIRNSDRVALAPSASLEGGAVGRVALNNRKSPTATVSSTLPMNR